MSTVSEPSTTTDSTTTLPDWSGGSGGILYRDASREPSGLAFANRDGSGYLYIVSDDGYILAIESGSNNTWESDHYGNDDDHDFECVAKVTGKLMIGVEGGVKDNSGNYSSPVIRRYDQTKSDDSKELGNFTGSEWTLDGMPIGGAGGMEALAFIPQDDCPSDWGTASYYGGFFLVAVQSVRGTVYVYDLPHGAGTSHTVDNPVTSFTDELLGLKISDMFYDADSKRLIVLYDDTARGDYTGVGTSDYVGALQVLMIDDDGTFKSTLVTRTPYVGSEGVVYHNSNLYIALDQSGSKDDSTSQWGVNGLTENTVTKYSNFELP